MKIYHGKQNVNQGGEKQGGPIEIFVTEDDKTRKLVHIVRHSPDGFQIGYGGSGPADAALSILTDCLGKEQANALYQFFKWSFVAHRDEGFSISEAEIKKWAERAFKDIAKVEYQ